MFTEGIKEYRGLRKLHSRERKLDELCTHQNSFYSPEIKRYGNVVEVAFLPWDFQSDVSRNVPRNSPIEKAFLQFAAKWRKETGHYSTMIHVTRNENYLRIIALGKPVIPYLLRDLEKEPDYWFEALKILTNDDPVPKEHLGHIDKMAQDWIKWGKKEKII